MFTKLNLTMSRYCITGPVWKTLLHSKMVYISIYSQVSKQTVSNRMFSPIHHTIRNDCKYVIQTRLIALTIWYPNVTNLFKSFRTNKIIKYLIYCFFFLSYLLTHLLEHKNATIEIWNIHPVFAPNSHTLCRQNHETLFYQLVDLKLLNLKYLLDLSKFSLL